MKILALRKILKYIFYLYIISILFLYHYGFTFNVSVFKGGSLRISDFFSCIIMFFTLLYLFLKKRITKLDVLGLLVFIFVISEIIFPLLGYFYVSSVGIINSLRMVLFWLPALMFFGTVGFGDHIDFSNNIKTIFKITLIFNFLYIITQMLVAIDKIPKSYLFMHHLEFMVVDKHYKSISGLRVSGFFVNSTALSVFAICAFILFYTYYIKENNRNDLYFALLSIFLIILSGSRMAVFTVTIIFLFSLLILSMKKIVPVLFSVIIFTSLLLLLGSLNETNKIFERFFRLKVGLLEDYSLLMRMNLFWPNAFEKAKEYPLGTMVSPAQLLGTIDSGYLTYYIQGKLFYLLIVLSMLFMVLTVSGYNLIYKKDTSNIMLFFLGIFLVLTMITSIPLRNQFIPFFLIYLIWFKKSNKNTCTNTSIVNENKSLVHYFYT